MTRLALKARNVATVIAARRLAPTIDPHRNGEFWLLDQVGETVTTGVDVGANVGVWAARALDVCPNLARLVCYEPSAHASQRLNGRLGADDRVTVVSAAVSDEGGDIQFFEEPDAGETSSAIPSHSRPDALRRTVDQVRLDDEVARLHLDRVDFLKIDAEGFDLRVLKGGEETLRAGRIGIAQFEYNASWVETGSTLREAKRLLGSAGYMTLLLTPRGLHEFDADEVGALLSYSNFVAGQPETLAKLEAFIQTSW